jgi:hypothetical protein
MKLKRITMMNLLLKYRNTENEIDKEDLIIFGNASECFNDESTPTTSSIYPFGSNLELLMSPVQVDNTDIITMDDIFPHLPTAFNALSPFPTDSLESTSENSDSDDSDVYESRNIIMNESFVSAENHEDTSDLLADVYSPVTLLLNNMNAPHGNDPNDMNDDSIYDENTCINSYSDEQNSDNCTNNDITNVDTYNYNDQNYRDNFDNMSTQPQDYIDNYNNKGYNTNHHDKNIDDSFLNDADTYYEIHNDDYNHSETFI